MKGETNLSEIQALDEALDALLSGEGNADAMPEIAGLVAVAGEFRAALAEEPDALPVERHSRMRSVALGVMAAALAMSMMTGTAFALSANSLPGQTMYPMKLAFERAALAMRTSEHGRAAFAWQLAQRRFAELRVVAGSAAADRARMAYEAALNRAEDTLGASDPVMLDQIEDNLSHHVTVLNELLTKVPTEAQPGIQRAIDRASAVEDNVHGRSANAPGRTKRRSSRGRP